MASSISRGSFPDDEDDLGLQHERNNGCTGQSEDITIVIEKAIKGMIESSRVKPSEGAANFLEPDNAEQEECESVIFEERDAISAQFKQGVVNNVQFHNDHQYGYAVATPEEIRLGPEIYVNSSESSVRKDGIDNNEPFITDSDYVSEEAFDDLENQGRFSVISLYDTRKLKYGTSCFYNNSRTNSIEELLSPDKCANIINFKGDNDNKAFVKLVTNPLKQNDENRVEITSSIIDGKIIAETKYSCKPDLLKYYYETTGANFADEIDNSEDIIHETSVLSSENNSVTEDKMPVLVNENDVIIPHSEDEDRPPPELFPENVVNEQVIGVVHPFNHQNNLNIDNKVSNVSGVSILSNNRKQLNPPTEVITQNRLRSHLLDSVKNAPRSMIQKQESYPTVVNGLVYNSDQINKDVNIRQGISSGKHYRTAIKSINHINSEVIKDPEKLKFSINKSDYDEDEYDNAVEKSFDSQNEFKPNGQTMVSDNVRNTVSEDQEIMKINSYSNTVCTSKTDKTEFNERKKDLMSNSSLNMSTLPSMPILLSPTREETQIPVMKSNKGETLNKRDKKYMSKKRTSTRSIATPLRSFQRLPIEELALSQLKTNNKHEKNSKHNDILSGSIRNDNMFPMKQDFHSDMKTIELKECEHQSEIDLNSQNTDCSFKNNESNENITKSVMQDDLNKNQLNNILLTEIYLPDSISPSLDTLKHETKESDSNFKTFDNLLTDLDQTQTNMLDESVHSLDPFIKDIQPTTDILDVSPTADILDGGITDKEIIISSVDSILKSDLLEESPVTTLEDGPLSSILNFFDKDLNSNKTTESQQNETIENLGKFSNEYVPFTLPETKAEEDKVVLERLKDVYISDARSCVVEKNKLIDSLEKFSSKTESKKVGCSISVSDPVNNNKIKSEILNNDVTDMNKQIVFPFIIAPERKEYDDSKNNLLSEIEKIDQILCRELANSIGDGPDRCFKNPSSPSLSSTVGGENHDLNETKTIDNLIERNLEKDTSDIKQKLSQNCNNVTNEVSVDSQDNQLRCKEPNLFEPNKITGHPEENIGNAKENQIDGNYKIERKNILGTDDNAIDASMSNKKQESNALTDEDNGSDYLEDISDGPFEIDEDFEDDKLPIKNNSTAEKNELINHKSTSNVAKSSRKQGNNKPNITCSKESSSSFAYKNKNTYIRNDTTQSFIKSRGRRTRVSKIQRNLSSMKPLEETDIFPSHQKVKHRPNSETAKKHDSKRQLNTSVVNKISVASDKLNIIPNGKVLTSKMDGNDLPCQRHKNFIIGTPDNICKRMEKDKANIKNKDYQLEETSLRNNSQDLTFPSSKLYKQKNNKNEKCLVAEDLTSKEVELNKVEVKKEFVDSTRKQMVKSPQHNKRNEIKEKKAILEVVIKKLKSGKNASDNYVDKWCIGENKMDSFVLKSDKNSDSIISCSSKIETEIIHDNHGAELEMELNSEKNVLDPAIIADENLSNVSKKEINPNIILLNEAPTKADSLTHDSVNFNCNEKIILSSERNNYIPFTPSTVPSKIAVPDSSLMKIQENLSSIEKKDGTHEPKRELGSLMLISQKSESKSFEDGVCSVASSEPLTNKACATESESVDKNIDLIKTNNNGSELHVSNKIKNENLNECVATKETNKVCSNYSESDNQIKNSLSKSTVDKNSSPYLNYSYGNKEGTAIEDDFSNQNTKHKNNPQNSLSEQPIVIQCTVRSVTKATEISNEKFPANNDNTEKIPHLKIICNSEDGINVTQKNLIEHTNLPESLESVGDETNVCQSNKSTDKSFPVSTEKTSSVKAVSSSENDINVTEQNFIENANLGECLKSVGDETDVCKSSEITEKSYSVSNEKTSSIEAVCDSEQSIYVTEQNFIKNSNLQEGVQSVGDGTNVKESNGTSEETFSVNSQGTGKRSSVEPFCNSENGINVSERNFIENANLQECVQSIGDGTNVKESNGTTEETFSVNCVSTERRSSVEPICNSENGINVTEQNFIENAKLQKCVQSVCDGTDVSESSEITAARESSGTTEETFSVSTVKTSSVEAVCNNDNDINVTEQNFIENAKLRECIESVGDETNEETFSVHSECTEKTSSVEAVCNIENGINITQNKFIENPNQQECLESVGNETNVCQSNETTEKSYSVCAEKTSSVKAVSSSENDINVTEQNFIENANLGECLKSVGDETDVCKSSEITEKSYSVSNEKTSSIEAVCDSEQSIYVTEQNFIKNSNLQEGVQSVGDGTNVKESNGTSEETFSVNSQGTGKRSSVEPFCNSENGINVSERNFIENANLQECVQSIGDGTNVKESNGTTEETFSVNCVSTERRSSVEPICNSENGINVTEQIFIKNTNLQEGVQSVGDGTNVKESHGTSEETFSVNSESTEKRSNVEPIYNSENGINVTEQNFIENVNQQECVQSVGDGTDVRKSSGTTEETFSGCTEKISSLEAVCNSEKSINVTQKNFIEIAIFPECVISVGDEANVTKSSDTNEKSFSVNSESTEKRSSVEAVCNTKNGINVTEQNFIEYANLGEPVEGVGNGTNFTESSETSEKAFSVNNESTEKSSSVEALNIEYGYHVTEKNFNENPTLQNYVKSVKEAVSADEHINILANTNKSHILESVIQTVTDNTIATDKDVKEPLILENFNLTVNDNENSFNISEKKFSENAKKPLVKEIVKQSVTDKFIKTSYTENAEKPQYIESVNPTVSNEKKCIIVSSALENREILTEYTGSDKVINITSLNKKTVTSNDENSVLMNKTECDSGSTCESLTVSVDKETLKCDSNTFIEELSKKSNETSKLANNNKIISKITDNQETGTKDKIETSKKHINFKRSNFKKLPFSGSKQDKSNYVKRKKSSDFTKNELRKSEGSLYFEKENSIEPMESQISPSQSENVIDISQSLGDVIKSAVEEKIVKNTAIDSLDGESSPPTTIHNESDSATELNNFNLSDGIDEHLTSSSSKVHRSNVSKDSIETMNSDKILSKSLTIISAPLGSTISISIDNIEEKKDTDAETLSDSIDSIIHKNVEMSIEIKCQNKEEFEKYEKIVKENRSDSLMTHKNDQVTEDLQNNCLSPSRIASENFIPDKASEDTDSCAESKTHCDISVEKVYQNLKNPKAIQAPHGSGLVEVEFSLVEKNDLSENFNGSFKSIDSSKCTKSDNVKTMNSSEEFNPSSKNNTENFIQEFAKYIDLNNRPEIETAAEQKENLSLLGKNENSATNNDDQSGVVIASNNSLESIDQRKKIDKTAPVNLKPQVNHLKQKNLPSPNRSALDDTNLSDDLADSNSSDKTDSSVKLNEYSEINPKCSKNKVDDCHESVIVKQDCDIAVSSDEIKVCSNLSLQVLRNLDPSENQPMISEDDTDKDTGNQVSSQPETVNILVQSPSRSTELENSHLSIMTSNKKKVMRCSDQKTEDSAASSLKRIVSKEKELANGTNTKSSIEQENKVNKNREHTCSKNHNNMADINTEEQLKPEGAEESSIISEHRFLITGSNNVGMNPENVIEPVTNETKTESIKNENCSQGNDSIIKLGESSSNVVVASYFHSSISVDPSYSKTSQPEKSDRDKIIYDKHNDNKTDFAVDAVNTEKTPRGLFKDEVTHEVNDRIVYSSIDPKNETKNKELKLDKPEEVNKVDIIISGTSLNETNINNSKEIVHHKIVENNCVRSVRSKSTHDLIKNNEVSKEFKIILDRIDLSCYSSNIKCAANVKFTDHKRKRQILGQCGSLKRSSSTSIDEEEIPKKILNLRSTKLFYDTPCINKNKKFQERTNLRSKGGILRKRKTEVNTVRNFETLTVPLLKLDSFSSIRKCLHENKVKKLFVPSDIYDCFKKGTCQTSVYSDVEIICTKSDERNSRYKRRRRKSPLPEDASDNECHSSTKPLEGRRCVNKRRKRDNRLSSTQCESSFNDPSLLSVKNETSTKVDSFPESLSVNERTVSCSIPDTLSNFKRHHESDISNETLPKRPNWDDKVPCASNKPEAANYSALKKLIYAQDSPFVLGNAERPISNCSGSVLNVGGNIKEIILNVVRERLNQAAGTSEEEEDSDDDFLGFEDELPCGCSLLSKSISQSCMGNCSVKRVKFKLCYLNRTIKFISKHSSSRSSSKHTFRPSRQKSSEEKEEDLSGNKSIELYREASANAKAFRDPGICYMSQEARREEKLNPIKDCLTNYSGLVTSKNVEVPNNKRTRQLARILEARPSSVTETDENHAEDSEDSSS